jgi:hypothetical protein
MKYIIFDDIFPVIFNEAISHNSIIINGMRPTSAGFVNINSIENELSVKTYGESISLGISSKKEDKDIIINTLLNY